MAKAFIVVMFTADEPSRLIAVTARYARVRFGICGSILSTVIG
jgi:hypothetical protein